MLTIRPGMVAEYKRRHDNIWPEMIAAPKAGGVVHNDIHLHEPSRRVFGHMLRARAPQDDATEDAVIRTWRRYMVDVLEMQGVSPECLPIERAFRMTD